MKLRNTFKTRILGSAAGGGLPQWNCNCFNCKDVRSGKEHILARSQSSIAVTTDNQKWVLLNASPDIRYQLNDLSKAYPISTLRDNRFAGIILVDSQIDHTTGLLIMREGEPLNIYCTKNVYKELTEDYPIVKLLSYYCGTNHHEIKMDNSFFQVSSIQDLEFKAVPLSGQPPPYSSNRGRQQLGDNIGIIVKHVNSDKYLFYAPGIGEITDQIREIIVNADLTLIDGTVWTSDEMISQGISEKTSYEMGHLPNLETLEILKEAPGRKGLIHINNTNPILNKDSLERSKLDRLGIFVSEDGMEFNV